MGLRPNAAVPLITSVACAATTEASATGCTQESRTRRTCRGPVTLVANESHINYRLPERLVDWIEETANKTGLSQGELVRQQLELARDGDVRTKKFLRLAGRIKGARDLSRRKGFAATIDA